VIRRTICLLFVAVLAFVAPHAALAADDDAAVLKPAEPDFTLINLPTSL
jgi:hypothetical protein